MKAIQDYLTFFQLEKVVIIVVDQFITVKIISDKPRH